MTQRTINQNSAFRLYLTKLAEQMDDAGLDMRTVIKVPIKPTQDNVLDEMVRPVMKIQFPHKNWKNPDRPSTTELSTAEISDLYEVMNRATGQGLGITVPFPSEEELFQRSQGRK